MACRRICLPHKFKLFSSISSYISSSYLLASVRIASFIGLLRVLSFDLVSFDLDCLGLGLSSLILRFRDSFKASLMRSFSISSISTVFCPLFSNNLFSSSSKIIPCSTIYNNLAMSSAVKFLYLLADALVLLPSILILSKSIKFLLCP